MRRRSERAGAGAGLLPALLLAALPWLASCTPGPSQPALRSVNTPEEHLWLRCVRLDPAFLSDDCRRFRSKDR